MSSCEKDFDDELLYVVADLSAYNDFPCSFKEICHVRRFSFLCVTYEQSLKVRLRSVSVPSDFVGEGGRGAVTLLPEKIYAMPEYMKLYVNKNETAAIIQKVVIFKACKLNSRNVVKSKKKITN